jgi:signal transduction histidine kinase
MIRFSKSQNGPSGILQIEIEDEGIGMPEMHQAGVGLRSMRERAEEVGGTFIIESIMNSGTRIYVKMPYL